MNPYRNSLQPNSNTRLVSRPRSRRGRIVHPVTAGLHDPVVIRMDAAGKNALQIALALDCSENTVRNRLAAIYPVGGVPYGC